jgi:dTDP-4-dehydrorhamnose 3,5-epimerase-like enzyme
VVTNEPRVIEGGLSVDDRGEVGFVNGFDFPSIKRFYTVANHREGFVRAWHAHKHEHKYATVLTGAALFGVVAVDNWDTPSKHLTVSRFVVSAAKPTILCIPQGYAHGYMTLTADTKIMFFSTSTLDESSNDDFRYNALYWDIWQVVQR